MPPTSYSDALEVVPAAKTDRPVFANLLQLYLYDMAPYFGTRVAANGRYDHEILDDAWELPYLFRARGEIAGFALITTRCTIRERGPCWYVAEFSVLRPFQGRGLGRAAFGALLARHPGDWEVTWFEGNTPAARFWPKAIPEAGRQTFHIRKHGLDWTSVAFVSRGG